MNQPCLPVPRRRKRDEESATAVSFETVEAMDAMEYMAAVVQQANSMPDIFVAPSTEVKRPMSPPNHVPIEGSAASLQYLISERSAVLPPPTRKHIPVNCREWVDGTIANFSSIREYLEHCRQKGVGGKSTERIPVPPMKDRLNWHIFCVGYDEAHGNEGSYFEESDEELEPENTGCNAPKEGYEPTVELLLQLDQVMIRNVISHLSYYAEQGWTISAARTKWLYALFSRLERPIHRDDAATMYGMLKHLTQVRSKTNPDKAEVLARINVLICVIGLYFEQGGGFENIFSC